MRVYLCEKPSQARDIAKVLGEQGKEEGLIRVKDGVVTWCFGHLLEQAGPDAYLPDDIPKTPKGNKVWRMRDLPIIPTVWQVDVRKDVRKQFGIIKNLLRSAKEVVISTDAGREGEMIAREILDHVQYRGTVRRLWLSAFDDTNIRKAFSSLKQGEETAGLYDAALARSRADWMVGMNLTRAFSLRGSQKGAKGVLSVGRVQTPTLALVVARDREIESFKPSPYWDVHALLRVEQGRFRGRWRVPDDAADSEGRCAKESAAHGVKADVEGKDGRITKAETKRHKEAPPLAYDLLTLQVECSAKFGMGAKKVLDIAQALYETHKLTTYPRTDCGFLPEAQHVDAPVILNRLVEGDPSLGLLIRQAQPGIRSGVWNDRKITEHHGIIPTAVVPKLDALSRDELRVYDLIRKRYIAQFFPDHEYDQTSVEAEVAGHVFTASGRVSRLEGWKVVYARPAQDQEGEDAEGASDDPEEGKASGEDQSLPPMRAGDPVHADRVDIAQKMTKPPRRYTEGTLLQSMKNVGRSVTDPKLKSILREKSGIGTEATRAGIIQTLLDREYLIKKKKDLISTEKARALIDALPEHVKSPVMTALWEQSLEDIAEGRRSLESFVRDQANFVTKIIDMVRQEIGNDVGGARTTVERPHVDCPACGAKQGAVRLHSPKTGRDFWKCEKCETFFEDKDGALDVETYIQKKEQLEAAPACPVCQKGRLVRREGSRGPFWACNAYPKCRAITEDRDGKPDIENIRTPEARPSGRARAGTRRSH